MSPQNFLTSLRRSLQLPTAGRAVVPVSRMNAEPLLSGRFSVSLLLDTSPSLDAYMVMMRRAYGVFAQQIAADPWLAERADVSLWALGDSRPAIRLVDWTLASKLEAPNPPRCSHTPLCDALGEVANAAVDRRHALTQDHNCEEVLNVVFVLSDFLPTDRVEAERRMHAALDRGAEAGVMLVLLTAGNVDDAMAASIAQPGRPPVPLSGVEDFTAFFKALARSLRQRSMSMPGEPVYLELPGHSLRIDQ